MRRLALLVTALLTAVTAISGLAPAASAAVDPGTGTSYETAKVVVPLVFPVVGPTSYGNSFLACRSGCVRMHMGQDLMGP